MPNSMTRQTQVNMLHAEKLERCSMELETLACQSRRSREQMKVLVPNETSLNLQQALHMIVKQRLKLFRAELDELDVLNSQSREQVMLLSAQGKQVVSLIVFELSAVMTECQGVCNIMDLLVALARKIGENQVTTEHVHVTREAIEAKVDSAWSQGVRTRDAEVEALRSKHKMAVAVLNEKIQQLQDHNQNQSSNEELALWKESVCVKNVEIAQLKRAWSEQTAEYRQEMKRSAEELEFQRSLFRQHEQEDTKMPATSKCTLESLEGMKSDCNALELKLEQQETMTLGMKTKIELMKAQKQNNNESDKGNRYAHASSLDAVRESLYANKPESVLAKEDLINMEIVELDIGVSERLRTERKVKVELRASIKTLEAEQKSAESNAEQAAVRLKIREQQIQNDVAELRSALDVKESELKASQSKLWVLESTVELAKCEVQMEQQMLLKKYKAKYEELHAETSQRALSSRNNCFRQEAALAKLEQEKNCLAEQLESQRVTMCQRNQEYAEMAATNKRISESLVEKNSECTKLQRKIGSLEAVQRHLEHKSGETQRLSEDAARAKAEETTKLRAVLSEQQRSSRDLVSELVQQKKRLEQQLECVVKSAEMRRRPEDAASAPDNEINNLRSKLSELRRTSKALSTEVQDLKAQIEDLKRLSEDRVKADLTQETNQQSPREREAMAVMDARFDCLRVQREDMKDQVATTVASMKAMAERNASLLKELRDAKLLHKSFVKLLKRNERGLCWTAQIQR